MKLLSPCLTTLLVAATVCHAEPDTRTLPQAFADDFIIGAAIHTPLLKPQSKATLDLTAMHFNSITSANMLKWGPFNPQPGVFHHADPDALVAFGEMHGMRIVGHVLFWHQQTPDWVFQDASGNPISRAALLERMRQRVRHLAQRYGSRIHAWDVVNEAILDDGSLRDSRWTRIIGDDFIEQAFRIANDELPADVDLLYNDYSMFQPGKRDAVVRMVHQLKAKGIRIDGVGFQGHWSLDKPSIEQIDTSITAIAKTGVDIHITELDIDVLPRKPSMHDPDVSLRLARDPAMNPYRAGLPDSAQQQLATRYRDLFALFLKHRDSIKRVTFWGVTDADSWLNHWPIAGRTSHPLLFDRQLQPKPAFHAVIALKPPHGGNLSVP